MTQAESFSTEEKRIYVACLAAYNRGILHGEWIEVTDDIDLIWEGIRKMLKSSPVQNSEEWALHDYEGFGTVRLNEYESIEHIYELSCFLQQHGEIGALALEYHNEDIEEAGEALERYQGCFKSLADYAQDLTEETIIIPENLRFYIDYQSMARDMKANGDVIAIQTRVDHVHVFLTQ